LTVPEAITPREVEPDPGRKTRLSIERLVFFSDAVFAIAITLLILDIGVPSGTASADSRGLFLSLVSLWPKYLAYFISFWVIGLSWISHHRKFLFIERADYPLLTLNLLLLMIIAFVPFPTAVMSESVTFTASAFYALTMILASLSGLLLWRHAAGGHRLVNPALEDRLIRREASMPLATIAVFAISIGVAFFEPGLARLCWLLVFPLVLILRRRHN
jgi:uncharacterized membrane protein